MGFDPVSKDEDEKIMHGKAGGEKGKDEEERGPEKELDLDYDKTLKRAKDEPSAMADISVNVYYSEEYGKSTKDMRGRVSSMKL